MISLTIAVLNDLEVQASDIQNYHLMATVSNKIWTILGSGFGKDAGIRAYIVRYLYGLKLAEAPFRNHLADCMIKLVYKLRLADQDLRWKPMLRPYEGHIYYANMLLYVDNCLCIHHNTKGKLVDLDQFFNMKTGSIGYPDIYLGAKIRNMSAKYVQEAVINV